MASGALLAYRRPLAVALAAVCALALLAGCGESKYEYVSNADEQTYYKVPKGYVAVTEGVADLDDAYLGINEVNSESLDALLLRRNRWSKVFDASPVPNVSHLTWTRRTSYPVVYSVVQHLVPEMRDRVSLDYMRDYLWPPVTETTRKNYEDSWKRGIETGAIPPGPPPWTEFTLLGEELLNPSDGIRGLRVRYNYEVLDGSVNTFDLTIYANNDSSVLYALMIRCDFQCYLARLTEIDDIATSFTVRSKS